DRHGERTRDWYRTGEEGGGRTVVNVAVSSVCHAFAARPAPAHLSRRRGRRQHATRRESGRNSIVRVPRSGKLKQAARGPSGMTSMSIPTTITEFVELLRRSELIESARLDNYLERLRVTGRTPAEPSRLAGHLVQDRLLTHFQATQLLQGKWRRFVLGAYKVLGQLREGERHMLYVAQHQPTGRTVVLKLLPALHSYQRSALQWLYREARMLVALEHPNLVRIYDVEQVDRLNFLVLERVDGCDLHEIVRKGGPLPAIRVAHYGRQAAFVLQHLWDHGVVHRNISHDHLLLDRSGTIKLIGLSVAFTNNPEFQIPPNHGQGGEVVVSPDFTAPEQAVDCFQVDCRADIY